VDAVRRTVEVIGHGRCSYKSRFNDSDGRR
jgi:hypothetical protein